MLWTVCADAGLAEPASRWPLYVRSQCVRRERNTGDRRVAYAACPVATPRRDAMTLLQWIGLGLGIGVLYGLVRVLLGRKGPP